MESASIHRPESRSIGITGDSTVDWMLVLPIAAHSSALHTTYQWEVAETVRIASVAGGAALLSSCISAAGNASDNGLTVRGPSLPDSVLANPSETHFPRTYSFWQPYPIRHGQNDFVWRMNRLLGADRRTGQGNPDASGEHPPACLVIDDANLGFRNDPDSWPAWLAREDFQAGELILKMSNPIGSGSLWRTVIARHSDRLTVYCSVDDLRKEYASVGQSLSWERTAMEIADAVREHSELNRARRIIVSVGFSGAVVVDSASEDVLIYDPVHQEGEWERLRPGAAAGLGTCLTAALAIEAGARCTDADWVSAVKRGLHAGRWIHDGRGWESGQTNGAMFPADALGKLLVDSDTGAPFQSVPIRDVDEWQISDSVGSVDYQSLAESIVIKGDLSACPQIPMERFGAWASIDRMEIESMRAARGIVREYLSNPGPTRPLSLAVFGPPGSGKSFAIKQMTNEPGMLRHRIKVFEFNLSQITSARDLPNAFHLLRDAAVEQLLPLVFWDEFDTALEGRDLGWLTSFLAPMQDGTFVDANVTRPTGPAIFIFAGGTHATMASFKDHAMQRPEAKATDFLSRLRGYLDILGPNPNSQSDRTFILRRALLLSALLRGKSPALISSGSLNIDPGVLRAFLNVKSYVHGARSIESLIDMSALSGRLRYERSALPPRNQLALHVDPDEFLGLVHGSPDSAT